MSSKRIRLARLIALAADFLQIVAFPLFFPGALAPWNDLLDLVTAAAVVRLLGWHWAFLPTFLAELVPAIDLFPSWTAAVFFVTRGPAGAAPPPTWPRLPQAPRDP